MIYKTTSVKEVIARVNRSTRNKDASMFGDILEIIPEGIGKLQTLYSLVPDVARCLQVKDYLAKLPCGLVDIEAVFYEGQRLITKNKLFRQQALSKEFQYVFKTTIDKHSTNNILPGEAVQNHKDDYYKIQLDYIHTSFECGELELYYWKVPVDCDGYPLIPDYENYKEALYWYILMKLIEMGYEHKVFDWNHCWNMFENVYAPRAIGEAKIAGIDQSEAMRRQWTRMIPPTNYYNDFDETPLLGLEQ